MRKLLAPTEDFIKGSRTRLAEIASKGSNVTLTLENNDGTAEDTYIVIGNEGSEKVEIQQINNAVVAGQEVRVATLLFDHEPGEPVTVYNFDKRKFYGCTTKDGSFVELTADGSPVLIRVSDPQGTLLEYTGVEGYLYFKATYFNSTTNEETNIADSEASLADETVRYCSIYGIRKMAGFTDNPYITDGRIEDKRRQAENEIDSAIFENYTLPLAEIPPLLTYVAECLAAGYLHYEEFGSEGAGVKKLGEARGILKAIQKGTQRLIGADHTELASGSTSGGSNLSGYPDASTPGPSFTRTMRF